MSAEVPLIDIVPPAVWLAGPHFVPAYTPAMRRWVCIVALLAGFSGQGYAWSVRPRIPIAIERAFDSGEPIRGGRRGLRPTAEWWRQL